MRFKKVWQRLLYSLSGPRRLRRHACVLECLEERTVPTIVWSNAGSRVVADYGGPVITHADVDLIFWGAGWNSAQALKTNVINSVTTILNSSYLSGLSQYRGIGKAQLLRTDDIASSSPAVHSTGSQYGAFVQASINRGLLPITPFTDGQILYMVIPQPGTSDPAENYGGAHSSGTSNFGRFHFGWAENISNLDDITYFFSHELTEAVTDPEVNFDLAFWVPSTNEEVCDGEAQRYSYRLNGVLVQSSLSQRDHAFEVYDGTTQKFILNSNRVLTVNGDQLSNTDDTITIDQRSGGYRVVLNAEAAQFDASDFFTGVPDVSSVVVNTGNGDDTVNIERTVSAEPVTVNLGAGNDTVNLGPTNQTLGALAGAITVKGNSGSDSLNFFDQGLRSSQTYTVTDTTITRSGIPRVTYSKLTNVTIDTSNSTDTITVQSAPAGTTLAINGGSGTNTITDQAADNVWTITGSNSGSLAGAKIAGVVTFSSVQTLVGGNNNSFVFWDGAVESGNIRSGSASSFDFSAYTTAVSVNLQTAAASGVGGTFVGIQNLTGGSGNNTLIGMNVANVWNLTGMNSGSVIGSATVAFTSFQNLQGGTAKNTFVFSDGAGISGNLDGGVAGSLDYSAYSSSVIVDLQTASATGIGGSLGHIQNVTGGAGGGPGVYNVLVGNGGNILTGGNGRRNLLIAGSSAGTLQSGDDDDFLIGGTTAYDKDIASLVAIMAYWSTTADDYATRVGNLLAGSGVPLLDPTTVTSNGGGNRLIGGPGLNLYYGNNTDTTDFDPTSTAVFVQV
jgi:hypothetical protein